MLDCILIELDPTSTLGGSCVADIYGTLRVLKTNLKCMRNINVLTTHSLCKSDTIKYTGVQFNLIDKLLVQMKNIISKCNEDLFILISGHGYQTKDISGDEEDGLDEYVRTKTEMILDDDLKKVIYSGNSKSIKIICDTCHSGSMFDIKNIGIPSIKAKTLYLGSSHDNQLSSCDISYSYGYGGALIVFLIDNNLLTDYLMGKNLVNIYNKSKKYLKCLGQIPVIAYE